MPMRLLFSLLLVCIWHMGMAQNKEAVNLVPNPGFEDFSGPPLGWFYKGSDFTSLMKFWDSPTLASPDAYGQNIRIPKHWQSKGFHLQKAHSGSSMVGLTMFGCENGKPHCREYVQIRLNEELVVGQNYYVEFYVSKLQGSMACNNFGVALSVNQTDEEIVETMDIMPLFNDVSVVQNKPLEWVKIRGGFQADSAYNFIVVGNFFDDIKTEFDADGALLPYAYYYFDDFLIKKIPPILPVPKEKEDLRDQVLKPGKVIQLKNIYFDFDKWDLHPRSFIELNKLLGILKEHPNMKIEIHGHTDSIGSENYNLYLSRKRARSVIAFLTNQGIDPSRLTYEAFGYSKPVESNRSNAGRAKNRRVEFKILNVD